MQASESSEQVPTLSYPYRSRVLLKLFRTNSQKDGSWSWEVTVSSLSSRMKQVDAEYMLLNCGATLHPCMSNQIVKKKKYHHHLILERTLRLDGWAHTSLVFRAVKKMSRPIPSSVTRKGAQNPNTDILCPSSCTSNLANCVSFAQVDSILLLDSTRHSTSQANAPESRAAYQKRGIETNDLPTQKKVTRSRTSHCLLPPKEHHKRRPRQEFRLSLFPCCFATFFSCFALRPMWEIGISPWSNSPYCAKAKWLFPSWRWSAGQSTGRIRKRRGKRRRENRRLERGRNQQTIKHTSWMTWRWNECALQTHWVNPLKSCSEYALWL